MAPGRRRAVAEIVLADERPGVASEHDDMAVAGQSVSTGRVVDAGGKGLEGALRALAPADHLTFITADMDRLISFYARGLPPEKWSSLK